MTSPARNCRWHAVRKARELELVYLRDLGVYEKIDENEAVAKYGITPVDTKWVDTDSSQRACEMSCGQNNERRRQCRRL